LNQDFALGAIDFVDYRICCSSIGGKVNLHICA